MEKPRFRVIARENFKRTPWKNGLGWTDQIAIYPEGSELRRGDFDWRVSTARISQSADFSIFPNHDRVLVVLEGNGVRLAHQFEPGEAPEIVVLQKDGVYEFPGDIPTRCDLVSGDGPPRDQPATWGCKKTAQ
jgi:environmental stress-induced protein Ves